MRQFDAKRGITAERMDRDERKSPGFITTEGWERFGTGGGRAETAVSKSERYQVRVSSYYKVLIIR